MVTESVSAKGGQCDLVTEPPPCDCTDVDPRVTYDSVVEYRCWDQMWFGKCGEAFMMNAIKEIPEGELLHHG
jgi:hypothetical protein